MKTSRLFVAACALLGMVVETLAQGTAFTYHGRLNNNGAPATGAFDMQFSVFDADIGNGLVAGPLPVNTVGVTNGLFTARIDFGAGVFTGPARWLEISVRPAGAGNFTTLSPRQELTSSPYSIRAQSAGTAADVSNGAVVKSLNNLRDNVTLAAGTNVTLTPNGNTLTIDSSSGLWSLNGANAFYNAGNVGIGTSTPQGLLDLNTGASDTSALFVRADPGSFGRGGIIHHQSATYGWQELAQKTGSPTDGFLGFNYVDRAAPGTKVASTVLALRGNGAVGIGTEAPETKLTVYSSLRGIEHTDGTVRVGTYLGAGGGWLGTFSNHKLNFFVNDGLPSMTVDTAKNVGIGTTAPHHRLSISGGPSWTSDFWVGALELDNVSAIGWRGNASGNRFGLGQTQSGLHFFATGSDPGTTGNPANYLMSFNNDGNVGIATTTPGHKLHIAGGLGVEGNAIQNRDRGGVVKAMIYVNADGTIARCYNGQTGSSTGNCGFTVIRYGIGDYGVLFGFQVTDRFASLTAHGFNGTFYYGPNVNMINVFTYYRDGSGSVDCPFTLIVY